MCAAAAAAAADDGEWLPSRKPKAPPPSKRKRNYVYKKKAPPFTSAAGRGNRASWGWFPISARDWNANWKPAAEVAAKEVPEEQQDYAILSQQIEKEMQQIRDSMLAEEKDEEDTCDDLAMILNGRDDIQKLVIYGLEHYGLASGENRTVNQFLSLTGNKKEGTGMGEPCKLSIIDMLQKGYSVEMKVPAPKTLRWISLGLLHTAADAWLKQGQPLSKRFTPQIWFTEIVEEAIIASIQPENTPGLWPKKKSSVARQ